MKRITELGKFENEFECTPYFWELVLGGEGTDFDDCGQLITRIEITKDDTNKFPDIPDQAVYVILWENGDGFVQMDFENENFAMLIFD